MFKNHCFSSIHTSTPRGNIPRFFPVKSHWGPPFGHDHSSTSRHRKALKSHDVVGFHSRCLHILKIEEKRQQVRKPKPLEEKLGFQSIVKTPVSVSCGIGIPGFVWNNSRLEWISIYCPFAVSPLLHDTSLSKPSSTLSFVRRCTTIVCAFPNNAPLTTRQHVFKLRMYTVVLSSNIPTHYLITSCIIAYNYRLDQRLFHVYLIEIGRISGCPCSLGTGYTSYATLNLLATVNFWIVRMFHCVHTTARQVTRKTYYYNL